MTDRDQLTDDFMTRVSARNPGEDEFLQAVRDVARDVITIEKADPTFTAACVLERLTIPDRIIGFRVTWEADDGSIQLNRGWRVQMSNAIGPYKGGIRFHPSVSPSVLKFLAFEQVFKNALTGLPLGGAKGGADFNPKGRSDNEIMRFCHAFMTELGRYIGPDRDVPAGDINVGTREIGYLFGAYKRQRGEFHGAITGKGQAFGGSALRVEATGYGLIYFVQHMLARRQQSLEGKRIAISGMGNVAIHAAEKAICDGGCVVALSDTSGTLEAPDGLGQEALDWIAARKGSGESISEPPDRFGLRFHADALPWRVESDIALPCATQNEIDADAADMLVDQGVSIVAEGANMPLTAEATDRLRAAEIALAPGKASNAGGVAISGVEMSQNAHGMFLSKDEVDDKLRDIMGRIHDRAAAEDDDGKGSIDYRRGANIAAYRIVADAVSAYGAI